MFSALSHGVVTLPISIIIITKFPFFTHFFHHKEIG